MGISVDVFERALAAIGPGTVTPMHTKAADFMARFECLRAPPDMGRSEGRGDREGREGRGEGDREGRARFHRRPRRDGAGAPHGHDTPARPRPRLGNTELSREALARKELLGVLNKLSPQNIPHMLRTLETSFRPDCLATYAALLWDFCTRMPEQLRLYTRVYAAIGRAVEREPWDALWRERFADHIREEAWKVPEDLVADAHAATASQEAYDDFCGYVLWKKRAKGAVHLWVALASMGVPGIDLAELCAGIVRATDALLAEQEPLPQRTDPLLEQVMTLAPVGAVRALLARHVQEAWMPKAASLPPSTRFKVYDLHEMLGGPPKS